MTDSASSGILLRSNTPESLTWDLTSIFKTDADWETSFVKLKESLPQLAAFEGRLKRSGKTLLKAYQLHDELSILLGKLYVYANMRHHEDTTNGTYQALTDRIAALNTEFEATAAFFVPEILTIPQERLSTWLTKVPGLSLYKHRLDEINRTRKHVRSAEVEEILAGAGEIGAAPGLVRDQLSDADIKYPDVLNAEGKPVPLTDDNYQPDFLESKDSGQRKRGFETMMGTMKKFRNTFAKLYASQVKKNIFVARARKYDSAIEAALSKDNLPVSVYTTLIETVAANMHLMDRYLKLKKRLLSVSELHCYDLYVPMIQSVDYKFTWETAKPVVLTALAPLGEDYVNVLTHGLNSRWTDVMPNAGKHSGAYSWGAYGTHPFMLLNWHDDLDNAFTLAHEAGHSMHSWYTKKTQPYPYASYTTFLAEIASTCNEALLRQHLLKTVDDKAVRQSLLNNALEAFRTTLFRQAMFAEFEMVAHARAEAGEALTADVLCEIHQSLNLKFYGRQCVIDDLLENEWMRIPHFYDSFYVFQYATGMSAAIALSKQILAEGEPARKRYIEFLSSGESDYSLDLLKKAGVDLSTPAPIQAALDTFGQLLDELEESLK